MKDEAYELMKEWEHSYWWYRARREIVCAAVGRFVPPGSEVVDYGCGTGSIARELAARGHRVLAADVAGVALSACASSGLRTLDLNEGWLAPGGADCVLACDVLEHVDDDVGLLVRFREALRPGGQLLVTVPAYEFLWSGEDYVSNHVRRYTRSLLLQRLRQAGYHTLWSSYFNTVLFPLEVAVILAKRLFRPRDLYRSNVQPLPSWINTILYKLFAMERSALKRLRFPFGGSILAVARPSEEAPARDLEELRSGPESSLCISAGGPR
jgi:SAM-dependent methyltransferase